MTSMRLFGPVLLGWVTVSCGTESPTRKAAAPTGPRDIVIASQANVHGDIEPCG